MGGAQQFWTPCKGPLADQDRELDAPALAPTPAAPALGEALDPVDRDLRFEVEREKLGNTLDSLFDRRVAAMEALLPRTEPAPTDDRHADLLILCASLALGAATAGIGGAAGAAVVGAVSGALLKEFVKSALKDAVDDALASSIRGCVAGRLGGGDAREGFFYGAGDALETAKLAAANEVADLRLDPELQACPDPGALLADARRGLESQLEAARQLQSHEGLLGWLDFLAKQDLGETDDGATDLAATHGDDAFFAEQVEADGVLHVDVRGFSVEEDKVSVQSARITGVNAAVLGELHQDTPASAGIPVACDAGLHLFSPMYHGGIAEISADDQGRKRVTADEPATRWLSLYFRDAGEQDQAPVSDAQATLGGATLLERLVMNQTFAALGVEVG